MVHCREVSKLSKTNPRRRLSTAPLLRLASCLGLSPVGDPPQYHPSTIKKLMGLLSVGGQFVAVTLLIGFELTDLYKAEQGGRMTRMLTVTADTGLFLGFSGLLIGYLRKVEHMPRVLEASDCLPGCVRWRAPVFILEMTIFTVPLIFAGIRFTLELRNVKFDAFALLMVVSSLEKFLFLHVTARVGTCFDAINNQLDAMRTPPSDSFSISDHPLLSEKIRQLRQLHLKACELLVEVTRSFEVQMLVFLVVEFIMTVLVVYLMALHVYRKTFELRFLVFVAMLLIVMLITILVLATCREMSAKGNRSPSLVHNMINNGRFGDQDLQQLLFFSMQTVNQEISVTPYDLVALDYGLLRSFVGSVAMYVVILVQFNVSSSAPPTSKPY